jgi:hypothetical protein
MKASDVARGFALGRVVVGGGLLLAPRLTGRAWVGDHADSRGATVFARGLGVRDVVLGALVLRSLPEDRDAARTLVAASAVSDATDFLATLVALPALPRRPAAVALAIAFGAAALGAATAPRL